ncbi:MAG: phosphate ABC transporter substrate-binding protein [Actinobacteria bacterium]|nr:phosphate ABC transporter substrate-binding protein [Actinomycetota bacterium]
MSNLRPVRICVALAAVGVIAVPATASAAPVITMSGSTSVAPLAALLARGYVKSYPGKVKFKLAQGGSDVGVADVAAGRVSIGLSSRDPKSSDPGGLVFNKVAKDSICIVTNSSNPITSLSSAQIKAIFSGSVRNWNDVSGSNKSGTIDVIVRTAASGTQDAFQKIFMGSSSVTGVASAKSSNGLIQQTVKSNPNAIGYVSFDFISGVHASQYNGVACNLRNSKSGEYGGVRNFWMVTRGAPRIGNPIWKFIKWSQNSSSAAKITGKHWVPIN